MGLDNSWLMTLSLSCAQARSVSLDFLHLIVAMGPLQPTMASRAHGTPRYNANFELGIFSSNSSVVFLALQALNKSLSS